MLSYLWGLKTEAFLDVWSIEHLLSGLSVGNAVMSLHRHLYTRYFGLERSKIRTRYFGLERSKIRTSYFDVISVLFLAYLWETAEHYMETGLVGTVVADWFQGVEFWANRMIADPLASVLGYYIAQRFPPLVNVARGLSLVWLVVHIFVFPHLSLIHI